MQDFLFMAGKKAFLSVVFDWIWRVLQHLLPSKPYLRLKYRVVFKRRLDLENPETFNEKLQWLKLYGCRPEYSGMVDKVEAKRYLAELVGPEYVIPSVGVWKNPEDIDFESLPQKFVLKCNHDSGHVIICTDKSELDIPAVRRELGSMLKNNYYLMGRETPYKDVPRRIIAEEYLEDCTSGELKDYKVHNFNGEPKLILLCQDRFSEGGLTEDFYTADWEHLDVQRPDHPNSRVPDARPEELDELIRLSRILSKDIPFLRTDFYIINHKVYVGELTFFPSSGFARFVPDEWDYTFGEWLELPSKSS